jgi:ribosome-associated toxin RatA of RatAB toxin-antitoxin module
MRRWPWLFALAGLVLCRVAQAGEWERVSESEGIAISWRQLPDARVREIRAAGIVSQPAARLYAVLRDLQHYPEFMPPTEAVEVLAKDADGAGELIHVIINPAWVSRRDYCVELRWTHFADGAIGSRWSQVNEGCPPLQRGIVRHTRTEGTWRLRELDGQRTFVEYQAVTDPGGSLPAWLIDRATVKAMRKMFSALASRAADPSYMR